MIEHIDGVTTISCDNCPESEDYDLSFTEAVKEARNEGWVVSKNGNEWLHFCSNECSISYP